LHDGLPSLAIAFFVGAKCGRQRANTLHGLRSSKTASLTHRVTDPRRLVGTLA